MPTKIAGFVLRCKDRKKTARFYAKLGLTTNEHQHGGPLHFEIGPVRKQLVLEFEEFVMEIYDASDKRPRDAPMLMVDSLKKTLKRIKKLDLEPKKSALGNGRFIYLYITDPDDRDVMLVEDTYLAEAKPKKKKKKSKRK